MLVCDPIDPTEKVLRQVWLDACQKLLRLYPEYTRAKGILHNKAFATKQEHHAFKAHFEELERGYRVAGQETIEAFNMYRNHAKMLY